jgi:hypothetical protein
MWIVHELRNDCDVFNSIPDEVVLALDLNLDRTAPTGTQGSVQGLEVVRLSEPVRLEWATCFASRQSPVADRDG